MLVLCYLYVISLFISGKIEAIWLEVVPQSFLSPPTRYTRTYLIHKKFVTLIATRSLIKNKCVKQSYIRMNLWMKFEAPRTMNWIVYGIFEILIVSSWFTLADPTRSESTNAHTVRHDIRFDSFGNSCRMHVESYACEHANANASQTRGGLAKLRAVAVDWPPLFSWYILPVHTKRWQIRFLQNVMLRREKLCHMCIIGWSKKNLFFSAAIIKLHIPLG